MGSYIVRLKRILLIKCFGTELALERLLGRMRPLVCVQRGR